MFLEMGDSNVLPDNRMKTSEEDYLAGGCQ